MTRLYISADLEGVCGVTSPRQCAPTPERSAYDWAVSQLEMELGAVIETALDQGVSHILVNDAHCSMANLYLEQVHPRVSLLSGKPKRCAMSAGLNERYDAALYVGYHAKAGTPQGVLCHTFHDKLFDVRVNGVSYGEGGINALYASLVHGVPVILASGDAAFGQEMRQLIPGIHLVETKVGLGHTAAQCHPLETVLESYTQQTRAALENRSAWKDNLLKLSGPYALEITFINTLAADAANTIPGLERLDGRTLAYRADNFQTVYQMLQSCYSILAYTGFLED